MIDVLTKVPSIFKITFFPLFLSFTVSLPLPRKTEVDSAGEAGAPVGDNFPYIEGGRDW